MDEGVSTSMDQLVGMLESRGAIKVSDAAKQIGTSKERVESWAKMLDKAGVVQLHYSVIGGAVIKRGPGFDALVKKGKKRVDPVTVAAFVSRPPQAETPAPVPRAAAQAAFQPAAAAPVRPEALAGQKDYALIRRKIDESEQSFVNDLIRLRGEQAKIVEYMAEMAEEGKKLVEYLEALKQMADELKGSRAETLPQPIRARK